MNLGKGLIGSLYLALGLLALGIGPVDLRAFLLLGISGLLGITLGDSFFFMSLMQLGPRLASLMGTLTPIFIAFSAFIFLGERPTLLCWAGIFFIVIGVAWVLMERMPGNEIVKNKSLGIKYRLLSIIFTTAGIILTKIAVTKVSAIQATFIRLFWATLGLILWGCLNRQLRLWLAPFKKPALLKSISFVVFIVIFGGFWLSILAIKYIDVSIAGVLSSTTPLFVLPMSAMMLKEKITIKSVLGPLLAISGVALILLGR